MSVFFQKTILHLVSHHSFTPPSCLHSCTAKLIVRLFFSPFSSFTFQKHSCSTTSQPNFSSSCTFSFCLSNSTPPPLWFFFLSSHSLSPLKGTWMGRGAAVFLTGLIGLIFYLEQAPMLHYTYIDLRLLCKSRCWHHNCESLMCVTAVSVKISIHYTYHLVAAFITSWCHACIQFYHARPRRESNH